MTDQTEPIRKSLLPCTPPPEWEFHTVLGARNEHSGVALLPGDTGPTVIRRRITYGGWEPVRPDRWAPEPPTDARPAPSAAPAPATDQAALRDRIAAALIARIKQAVIPESTRWSAGGAATSFFAATEYDLADVVLAELPAPVDRAAVLRDAAGRLSMDWGGPNHEDGMDEARTQLRRMADEPQP